jgi:hypothetical protein
MPRGLSLKGWRSSSATRPPRSSGRTSPLLAASSTSVADWDFLLIDKPTPSSTAATAFSWILGSTRRRESRGWRHDEGFRRKGSNWHGTVVGYYATKLTPKGVAVESDYEEGSVQIYPAHALESWS